MSTPLNENTGGIVWDFSITAQNQVARYGHLGSEFYKQFLPYGILMPDKHPPKRIAPYSYQIAHTLWLKDQGKIEGG